MTITIACLLYEGFQLLDLAGPLAAFEVCGYAGVPGYTLQYGSPCGQPVTSSYGDLVGAGPPSSLVADATLLVPGGFGAHDPANVAAWLPFLRDAAARGQRIVAVGSGVRVLAASGVLKGRRVVSHWGPADKLAMDYPDIAVDDKLLYLRDGNFWTAAGVGASTDVALAVVEQDYGSAVSRRTAQSLVLPSHRSGTEHQRSKILELSLQDDRLGSVIVWAQEHLEEPLPIERLADRAALSVRHFTRAFTLAFGIPPAKAIERLRIDAAMTAIEAGLSLDAAARMAGFENAGRMRRSFARVTGSSPRAAGRRRFLGEMP